MTTNHNAKTGIPYGYVAACHLDSELVQTLLYGSQANNLSDVAACAEEESRQRAAWEEECERLTVAAQEAGKPEPIFENFEADLDDFDPQIEEPVIEGVYEDVIYCTSWLGGALNFFITQSPMITTNAALSSMCVPGAGILLPPGERDGTVLCYDVPPTWWYVDPDAPAFEQLLDEIAKDF